MGADRPSLAVAARLLPPTTVRSNLPFVGTYQDGAFEALADGTRRRVLELVAARPRSVAEIAAELPVSRPAVSQHLKVLLEAGLVTVTPAGTRRLYALEPAGLAPLRAYLEQFWNRALADFKEAAERPVRSDQPRSDQPRQEQS
jgi:DNA-binding transcriptional ArsR family regulator